jgi:hypothetical protein
MCCDSLYTGCCLCVDYQHAWTGTISITLRQCALRTCGFHDALVCNHGCCWLQSQPGTLVLQKLWNSTVRGLPPDTPTSEVEASLSFFAVMCDRHVLDFGTLCDIVNDCTRIRPAHSLSICSLDKVHDILLSCNSFHRSIADSERHECDATSDDAEYFVAHGQNRVIGMDYIFMVLIDARDDMVARRAAHLLVRMYIKPYAKFTSGSQSWTGCAS